MKKLIAIIFCFIGYALPVHAYVEHETAILRIMNKAAGKTQTVSVPVGNMRRYEKLDILVRTCKQTDPFQAEDFLAFVEITRNAENKIFSNWMRRNDPGDKPLQDVDYDVWLVRCE